MSLGIVAALLQQFGPGGGVPAGPDAPTLAAADNGDGTGAVATISGSSVGSSNAVSTLADGSATWVLAGTRSGDGTVALALAQGYYWVRVVSTLNSQTAVSNVVRLAVTDTDDSVHQRASQAIAAAIAWLDLYGAEDRVYRQTLPTEEAVEFPAVLVWFNEGETVLGGSNNRDDIGYPVHVGIADRKKDSLAIPPDQYLSMRQRIMRRLRFQHLTGVPEVYSVVPQPMPVVDEKLPAYNYLVSGITFVCVSREVRG